MVHAVQAIEKPLQLVLGSSDFRQETVGENQDFRQIQDSTLRHACVHCSRGLVVADADRRQWPVLIFVIPPAYSVPAIGSVKVFCPTGRSLISIVCALPVALPARECRRAEQPRVSSDRINVVTLSPSE